MVAVNDFQNVFPVLARDVISEVEALNFPREAVEYIQKMVNYTVPGGTLIYMPKYLLYIHSEYEFLICDCCM